MAQPPQVDAAVDVIVSAFRNVQTRLETEYAQILTNPRKAARRNRIRGVAAMISRELSGLDDTAGRWIADEIPKVYELGANATPLGFRFDQFHREAVAVLQADLYDDVLAATTFMRDDSKRWIRDASRLLAAEGHIEGVAPRELARRFARSAPRALDAAGLPMPITAARYKDGSVRTIDDYADMLFRTKTAAAHNSGTINRSRQLGINRFEIRDGAGCGLAGHGDGADANGMIVDADTAAAYPLAHPRCRRVFIARPDLDDDSPVETPPEGTPPGPVPLPDPPGTEAPSRQPRTQRQPRAQRRRSTQRTQTTQRQGPPPATPASPKEQAVQQAFTDIADQTRQLANSKRWSKWVDADTEASINDQARAAAARMFDQTGTVDPADLLKTYTQIGDNEARQRVRTVLAAQEQETLGRLIDAGNSRSKAQETWERAIRNVARDTRVTDKTAAQLEAVFDAVIEEALTPLTGGASRFDVRITRQFIPDDDVRVESLRWLDTLANEFPNIEIGKVGSAGFTGAPLGNALGAAGGKIRDGRFVDTFIALKRHTPSTVKANFDTGFLSTPSAAHAIVHEFGHFLDYKLRETAAAALPAASKQAVLRRDDIIEQAFQTATTKTWRETRRQIADEISDYAATSPAETFAEAFAMVQLTPDDAPEIARQLVSYVAEQVRNAP